MRFFGGLIACVLLLAPIAPTQTLELVPAPQVRMPGAVDSNSPAHWLRGLLYLFNSVAMPVRSEGPNIFSMGQTRTVLFSQYVTPHRWIESTWQDHETGFLYGWYHYEPGLVCGEIPLTAPQIGAAVSYNNGESFHDLGIVLESGDEPDCEAQNGYFAGGHGDFTVIASETGEYLYFYFGNYGGEPERQGVAVARLAVSDIANQAGNVWKYADGGWNEPGLGGRVTPVFPARVNWGVADTDAFWGPSLHYNTSANRYVMLMTRSCCSPGWPSEGLYVSFNAEAGNPAGWSEPLKLLDAPGWYPQVIGLGPRETDKRAGELSRLFIGGESSWEILIRP